MSIYFSENNNFVHLKFNNYFFKEFKEIYFSADENTKYYDKNHLNYISSVDISNLTYTFYGFFKDNYFVIVINSFDNQLQINIEHKEVVIMKINWIEKNKGDGNVDIANTKFEDLPGDWQQENLSSAGVAVEKIEDVLNLVHDKWLDRNDENAGLEQKVQFSRLSPAEKLKDIAILKKALEVMEKSL